MTCYRNTMPSQYWHQHSTRDTLEQLLSKWCLQQAAPPSVLLTATQRNVCFRSPQIMGHLSWQWVIQGTQLQQKASERKGITFNPCPKFCAWAIGEQGKAFLRTDLEMTEVAVPKHVQFNAPTQFSSISQMSEDHVSTHPILQSSVAEVKLCPLDTNYKFNRRLHATTMNITNGDDTALCALFLPRGEAVENF